MMKNFFLFCLFGAVVFFFPLAVFATDCSSSDQCLSNEYCDPDAIDEETGRSQCVPQKRGTENCTGAEQCFTGLCQSGRCVAQCTETSCPNGQYCNGKVCVNERPAGAVCGDDVQCLSGVCLPNGTCSDTTSFEQGVFTSNECSPTLACPEGDYCSGIRCLKKRVDGDVCDTEVQCVSGYCDLTLKVCAAKAGTKGATETAAINRALARIDTLFPEEMQKDPDLQKVVGGLINGVLGIIGTLALVIFLYSGIMWMTAQGKKETVEDAKHTMIYAAIGLFIVFGSYMFVSFIIKSISF